MQSQGICMEIKSTYIQRKIKTQGKDACIMLIVLLTLKHYFLMNQSRYFGLTF
jgi:hypothetical protein